MSGLKLTTIKQPEYLYPKLDKDIWGNSGVSLLSALRNTYGSTFRFTESDCSSGCYEFRQGTPEQKQLEKEVYAFIRGYLSAI